MKKEPAKPINHSEAMSLGLNMLAGMAVFTCLGFWVDQKRGGGQVWTLVGMFLGLFYCGYEVWKVVRGVNETHKKNDRKRS